MRISLGVMLSLGNADALANAERALTQREQDDASVEALVAALATRDSPRSTQRPAAPVAA